MAGGHCGINRFGGAITDASRNLQHILTAHTIGQIEVLFGVRIKNDLHNAFAVAHVEKDHPAVIASSVYPTTDSDGFADSDILCSTTIMCPHQYSFYLSSSCLPQHYSDDVGEEADVADAEAPLESDFESLAKFFFAPVLKSVSYQPDPASLNAGADTFFFKDDWPHAGQSVSGASDIFCSASCALPQAPHTYS